MSHKPECACCAVKPYGEDPIEKQIRERGMAIIQLMEENAPPLYYSVGVSGPKGDGFEFLIAGIEPEVANSIIVKCWMSQKDNPDLFEGSIIRGICPIVKNKVVVHADLVVRPVTNEVREKICCRVKDHYKRNDVKILQVFIPDRNGLRFGDDEYDPHLNYVQCPFISDPDF